MRRGMGPAAGLLVLALGAARAGAGGLAERGTPAGAVRDLASLCREAEAKGGMRLGLWARRLPSGRVLVSRRAEEPFLPASNMKLFTAWLFLETFGVAPTSRTRFYLVGVGKARRLRLRTEGDPTRAREFGLAEGSYFRKLREALLARRIDLLPGGVEWNGEDWPGPDRPPDWPASIRHFSYAPPTGGLVLDQGKLRVRLDPVGRTKGACPFTLQPRGIRLPVKGRVLVTTDRRAGSRPFVSIGPKGLVLGQKIWNRRAAVFTLAQRDPEEVFLQVLGYECGLSGIRLGRARSDRTSGERGTLLLEEKHDLLPALEAMLRESENFQAEQALRLLAFRKTGKGDWRTGRSLLEKSFERLFERRGTWVVGDGSGLSKRNRISPSGLGTLLSEMPKSPRFPALWTRLAANRGPGTLKRRLSDLPPGRVRAKTGTLNEACALSGFLVEGGRPVLAFVILMQRKEGKGGRAWSVRKARKYQDEIVRILAGRRDAGGASRRGTNRGRG